jgi:hypothetical protein
VLKKDCWLENDEKASEVKALDTGDPARLVKAAGPRCDLPAILCMEIRERMSAAEERIFDQNGRFSTHPQKNPLRSH